MSLIGVSYVVSKEPCSSTVQLYRVQTHLGNLPIRNSGMFAGGVLQRQLRQITDTNEKIGPSRVRRICVTLPGRTALTPSLKSESQHAATPQACWDSLLRLGVNAVRSAWEADTSPASTPEKIR